MSTTAALGTVLEHTCTGSWTGMAYGRSEAFWWTGDANGTRRRTTSGFAEVDWRDVYEIRAFDGTSELRWWEEDAELGRFARVDVPTGAGVTEERWLLWGTVAAAAETDDVSGRPWVPLSEARIGTVWTPLDGAPGDRAALVVSPRYDTTAAGNVSIADETFTRLATHGGA